MSTETVMQRYNRKYLDAVRFMEADQLDECIAAADALLDDLCTPRFIRMKCQLLLANCLDDFTESERYADYAASIWEQERRRYPLGSDASADAALEDAAHALAVIKAALTVESGQMAEEAERQQEEEDRKQAEAMGSVFESDTEASDSGDQPDPNEPAGLPTVDTETAADSANLEEVAGSIKKASSSLVAGTKALTTSAQSTAIEETEGLLTTVAESESQGSEKVAGTTAMKDIKKATVRRNKQSGSLRYKMGKRGEQQKQSLDDIRSLVIRGKEDQPKEDRT